MSYNSCIHHLFSSNSPPKSRYRAPLAPEDEELLRDDDVVTPVKSSGIKRKERPTDKGVSWLVKTQYISSLSTDSTRQVRIAHYSILGDLRFLSHAEDFTTN